MKNFFNESEVSEFEFVNIATSHSAAKLTGVKNIIESAKVRQLNHWDPVFEGRGIWSNSSDLYGDDFVWEKPNGTTIPVEYKLTIRTFHDPIHFRHLPIQEYCTLSNDQFKRYKQGEDNKHFFIERCVINFDESTKVGRHNCLAYSIAKKPPEQQWDYLMFQTTDLSNWRPNKDYWLSVTKDGEELVVFRKDIIEKRRNLVKHINKASERGVLLTKEYDETNSSKNMDSVFWS